MFIMQNNMTNEKKIIWAVIILLFAGFSFLFYSEQKQLKSTAKNGWWAVYFENPKLQDLSFTVENNKQAKKFHWKEILENNIIQEADIIILAGEKKTIMPDAKNLSGKIIIEVVDEAGNKKEIYKIIAGTGL